MEDVETRIIFEIQAGNPRRFGVLVDRHKNRAMTLALRIVGNRSDAEELVQDAFVRAFRSMDRFRGESKFGTWFYRILYNLCLTSLARRGESPEPLEGLEESSVDLPPTGDPTVLEDLVTAEALDLVRLELDTLPEKFRAALTLFYVQEMSYDEIASVMRVPVGTVKTHLFRGRVLLKKNVMAKMQEEGVR